jgi:hypothetical protein
LESGMLTNYRDETAFCQLCDGARPRRIRATRPEPMALWRTWRHFHLALEPV